MTHLQGVQVRAKSEMIAAWLGSKKAMTDRITGDKIMNHVVHQEIDYNSSPEDIYAVLTDPGKFSEMTGGAPAEIDPATGGAFSLFGGMILGVNAECSPGQRLVQAWRAANWDPGVYSIVRFELTAQNGGTRVVLDHTGYPEDEGEHLDKGWHDNYWDPMRNLLSS